MTKTDRRERMRDVVRDEIKAAAWKQIGEGGAAALSLRGVAVEMGVTAPALYRYFKDRDSLVTSLIMDAFSSFADALEAARDARPEIDHAGRFRAICLTYRSWAVANPQRYLLIFGTPFAGYTLPAEAWPVSRRSFLVLLSVVGEAYLSGYLRLSPDYERLTPGLQDRYRVLLEIGMPYSPVVVQLALSAWGWIHGLTSLELYGYLTSFLESQVEDFVLLEIEAFMQRLGFREIHR